MGIISRVTMDANQKQKQQFIQRELEMWKSSGADIRMRLFPPMNHTMIQEYGNRMLVKVIGMHETFTEEFTDVSEQFYDEMCEMLDNMDIGVFEDTSN